MRSSVKSKIRAGTLFLFLLVVLSGGFSIYYLVQLKNQSATIVKANYQSVEYVHNMQKALDNIVAGQFNFIDTLKFNLKKQEANITERGEAAATKNLAAAINKLPQHDDKIVSSIRYYLHQISDLNIAAIKSKSLVSEKAAKEAVTYLITIILLILLVGFTFVFNFPSVITAPIRKLTEGINEISQKNYKHRIHIQSKDELGDLANSFNEMAERLEYFESSNLNKILFEKARAEAVINSLKDASIGIDKNGLVLFANNQALQLLGLQTKNIVGVQVAEVAKRNDLFQFLVQEKGTNPFKIIVDGKENYFTRETIDVDQEGLQNKVIVLKNITSFKELDVAKTNFIATISHELKTPLAASGFSLKLLEDERIGALSNEQKELLQNIKSDNQRMLRILSELLNMAQVEAGKIQLQMLPVDPLKIITAALQNVQTTATEKRVRIIQTIPEIVPLINADAERAGWVLTNFLTNAIKYSPPGSEVEIKAVKKNSLVLFSVNDKGQGIDEAYVSKIFDRYFQVPGRSDKNGSGIGLAICKELIEAMDGEVWVESFYEKGSTFGFSLQLAKAE